MLTNNSSHAPQRSLHVPPHPLAHGSHHCHAHSPLRNAEPLPEVVAPAACLSESVVCFWHNNTRKNHLRWSPRSTRPSSWESLATASSSLCRTPSRCQPSALLVSIPNSLTSMLLHVSASQLTPYMSPQSQSPTQSRHASYPSTLLPNDRYLQSLKCLFLQHYNTMLIAHFMHTQTHTHTCR